MRVVLDTNVILDMLLEREPFVDEAAKIFRLAEQRVIQGYIAPTSVTTVHYLVSKALGRSEADRVIGLLLQIFEVVPVDKEVLLDAIERGGSDFEDSVILTAAQMDGVDLVVTRDRSGFRDAKIEVMDPGNFLEKYGF